MIEAAKALKRLEQERDENWQRYVDADAALLDAQDEIATLKGPLTAKQEYEDRIERLEAEIDRLNYLLTEVLSNEAR